MKTKIYIKTINPDFFPKIIGKGDWIDLAAAETVEFSGPLTEEGGKLRYDYKLINLGVGMQLPKGMEAHVLPRSSTFKKKGLMMVNSMAIIDNSYNGDNDIWRFAAMAFRKTTVYKNETIAQFRIVLSQKATLWQKIKWHLSSGVKLIPVNTLGETDRGGFGSTGGMQ